MLAFVLCSADTATESPARDDALTATDLWDWLQERTPKAGGHPNIDHQWKSKRLVQAGLRRLGERGLIRSTRGYYFGAPLVWYPTLSADVYLREKRLFPDDEPDHRVHLAG